MVAHGESGRPALKAGAPFLHYELLGPRADLESWLASVQDTGVCHLADALNDLEGHAGIGRPALRAEEVHAELLRSEAGRALRGVARVLPPTPREEEGARRPQWTLGPGGVGEREVHTLKDEARDIATRVGEALQDVHERESEARDLDALRATVEALTRGASTSTGGLLRAYLFRIPSSRWGHRARRLERVLRSLALPGAGLALRTHARGGDLVVIPKAAGSSAAVPTAEVLTRVGGLGAEWIEVPATLAGVALEGVGLPEARTRLAKLQADAERAEAEARAKLSARVADLGVRGRFLLDSLEDAEGRTRVRRFLASSEHVTAARLYDRREDEPRLREQLHAAHGESVVLRPLAPSRDAPSLPRRIAASPFAVVDSLLPRRFGDVSAAAVLALVTPLAVGLIWADVAGGVFLLLAGALLGSGARRGSPRRDTALLAQLGGLASLILGVLAGRAFGPAGSVWFGAGWGGLADASGIVIGQGVEPQWARPFLGVAWVLGAVAALCACWGAILSIWSASRGRSARARSTLVGSLHYVVFAGVAAALLSAAQPLSWAWILAPVAALGVLLLGGPRRFLFGLCLDLVGGLRLVAVAGCALLIFDTVLASWIDPTGAAVLVGSLALVVAALAVVADPAHLAMGVPYDLALGGRRLGRPFEPFQRRRRSGLATASTARAKAAPAVGGTGT